MGYPFALVLHTHLPMVVNHGRWPHGSDWLNEAAFECYLPLLEVAHRLVGDGISPKWTLNLSPVLVEQLASPEFQKELSFYYENVRRACADSREHFAKVGAPAATRCESATKYSSPCTASSSSMPGRIRRSTPRSRPVGGVHS